MTSPDVQTRVFRSPYWIAGWGVTVIAVVGTVAFFVGGAWGEFAGAMVTTSTSPRSPCRR